jgi:hypothetical protein
MRSPRWLTKTLKHQVINALNDGGEDTGPYLVRWAINTRFGGVKLHHFLRSDEDRDLHDHPWSFLSIILWGGYWEHVAGPTVPDPDHCCSLCVEHSPAPGRHCALNEGRRTTIRTWYGPGSILWRPAPSVHRVELREGRTAWTLVFTGPKRREWGFHTICGFIPWPRYARAKQEGC